MKMPVISFQAILDKALDDYSEQIGVELDKHPFADELQGRGSPDDILKLFEAKANAFKAHRDGNRKLINWLSPVVQVIDTLSGVIGQAVSVSSMGLVGPLDILAVLLPGPIPTCTGDLRWRRCSNHGARPFDIPPYKYHDPHTSGSQWCQLKLRCTRRLVRMCRKLPQTPSHLYRCPHVPIDDGDSCKDHGGAPLRLCPRYQAN